MHPALPYRDRSRESRATALSLIVAAHLVLVAVLVDTTRMREIAREMTPLVVRMLPVEREVSRLSPPAPAPALRLAEVRLPIPPPVDIAIAIQEETRAPSPPSPVAAAAAEPDAPAAEPVASIAPPFEPPRADLAYLHNPAPAYPAASRRAGEQGRVMLRVHVDEHGRALAVQVVTSSGFARLDEAAARSVRRWRFVPASVAGRPVAGWAFVPIDFELKG
jgi:protein TonB